jgi:hypothetical protein
MNNEMKGTRIEKAMTQLELAWRFRGKQRGYQSGYLVSGSRFETGTSAKRSRHSTHSTKAFGNVLITEEISYEPFLLFIHVSTIILSLSKLEELRYAKL